MLLRTLALFSEISKLASGVRFIVLHGRNPRLKTMTFLDVRWLKSCPLLT